MNLPIGPVALAQSPAINAITAIWRNGVELSTKFKRIQNGTQPSIAMDPENSTGNR